MGRGGVPGPGPGEEAAAEEESADEDTEAEEDEGAEDEDEGDDEEDSAESAERANAASLLQLKNDALARFDVIRGLYEKKMQALEKRGSQDLSYLALQQQISDELLNIRFTAKAIEKLCDSVRGMVESARKHERKILELCVDKGNMPRAHFIKVFPGNEVNIDWLKGEITHAKANGAQLLRAAPAIIEEQGKLIDIQRGFGDLPGRRGIGWWRGRGRPRRPGGTCRTRSGRRRTRRGRTAPAVSPGPPRGWRPC